MWKPILQTFFWPFFTKNIFNGDFENFMVQIASKKKKNSQESRLLRTNELIISHILVLWLVNCSLQFCWTDGKLKVLLPFVPFEQRHHIGDRSLSLCNMFLDEMAKQARNLITDICTEQCTLSDQVRMVVSVLILLWDFLHSTFWIFSLRFFLCVFG